MEAEEEEPDVPEVPFGFHHSPVLPTAPRVPSPSSSLSESNDMPIFAKSSSSDRTPPLRFEDDAFVVVVFGLAVP